jgi:hypothetical protein
MRVDLKNLIQWPTNSALQAFSVVVKIKITTTVPTVEATIATIQGKRKLTLVIKD